MSILAPGMAASARALICSRDSIIAPEHRPLACAPSGKPARCFLIQRSGTPLGAQTESLCSRASCPLDLRRPKNIRISRRLQIMRAKGRHRKLARLGWIEVLGFVSAGQFLTIDL